MPETLAQVFSCEFCEIFKKAYFHRTPPVAASEKTKCGKRFSSVTVLTTFTDSLIKSNILKSVKSWVFDMQKYQYSGRALNELRSDNNLLIFEIKKHIFSYS